MPPPIRRIAAAAATVATGWWTFGSSYSQVVGPFPYRGRSADRIVALTFDDGPNEPYTTRIADHLADRGIRATFFQVGRCVERHPHVTERLAAQGHVIGNHSWSHQMSRCLTPKAQRTQTAATQAILTARLGRTPALYRPPWLLRTPSLFSILRAHGLQPVSGEFGHAFEVFQPSARRMAGRALAKVRPGAILIFHDGVDGRGGYRGRTAEAVTLVVDELRRRDYAFVTVDELLGVPAYTSVGSPAEG